MNFAWAMKVVLEEGRAVRREMWNKSFYILVDDDDAVKMISRNSGYYEPFWPQQVDMLAEDWVEVLEV